jgi:hypothetical protein
MCCITNPLGAASAPSRRRLPAAVKGNQALIPSEIAELFAAPLPTWLGEQRTHQVNKGDGRLEILALCASTVLAEVLAPYWPDGAQGFQIKRTITRRATTAHVLAILNTALRVLCDYLGSTDFAAQMPEFMAFPATALSLLLTKPDY